MRSLTTDKEDLEQKLDSLALEDQEKAVGLAYAKLIRFFTDGCSKIVEELMTTDLIAIRELETTLADIHQLKALDPIFRDIDEDELLTESLDTISQVKLYAAEKKISMSRKISDLEHGFISVVRTSVTVLASELVGKQLVTKNQEAILGQLRLSITEVYEAMPKPRDVFIGRLKAVFAEDEEVVKDGPEHKDQDDQEAEELDAFARQERK